MIEYEIIDESWYSHPRFKNCADCRHRRNPYKASGLCEDCWTERKERRAHGGGLEESPRRQG